MGLDSQSPEVAAASVTVASVVEVLAAEVLVAALAVLEFRLNRKELRSRMVLPQAPNPNRWLGWCGIS